MENSILSSNTTVSSEDTMLKSIDDAMNTNDSPSSILNKYTSLELHIKELEKNIESFKTQHQEIFNDLIKLEEEINNTKLEQSNLVPMLTESMENTNTKNISNNLLQATFVAATTRRNFDKKTFEKENLDLFNKYVTVSDVKAYVKISEVK